MNDEHEKTLTINEKIIKTWEEKPWKPSGKLLKLNSMIMKKTFYYKSVKKEKKC